MPRGAHRRHGAPGDRQDGERRDLRLPPRRVQGLQDATLEWVAEPEVIGVGYALHGESFDLDYTALGLRNGIFAVAKWMAARAGGRARRPRRRRRGSPRFSRHAEGNQGVCRGGSRLGGYP